MSNRTIMTAGQTGLRSRPLVVVLHTAAEAALALHLIRAWAPMMPAGDLVGVTVEPHDISAAVAQLRALVHEGAPGPGQTILVGASDAAHLALRIGLAADAWACAAVLACGPMPLPLSPLTEQGVACRTKLRLIWTARDPLQGSAALGALLRCLREAGLDAQGAVLNSRGGTEHEADEGCGRSEALVRLSGAYLAELVADTLGPAQSAAPARGGAARAYPPNFTAPT